MSPKKKNDKSQIKVSVGSITDISGSNEIAGDKITIAGDPTTDAPPPAVSKLFEEINRIIEERPDDPNVEKGELKNVILLIETEVRKGDSANTAKLSRWLRFLSELAPDVFDAITASVANRSQSEYKILQKALAGDSTTDAPPPPKKDK